MLRKLFFLVLALALTISLVGCDLVGKKEGQDVVAIVNGEEIKEDEYKASLEQQKMQYQQFGIDFESAEGKKMLGELEVQVLEDLIDQKLILNKAKEEGFEASEEEINAEMEGIKAQFEDEAQFNQALETNNLTVAQLEQDIANSVIMQKYTAILQSQLDEVTITQEELEASYEQYLLSVDEPEDFEDIKPQLEMQLNQQKQQEQFQIRIEQVLEELREQSDIQILI